MEANAPSDPVRRLAALLEEGARDLHTRLGNRKVPKFLRARGRRFLREVFQLVESAPEPAVRRRKAWVDSARAMIRRLAEIDERFAGFERPPAPFYTQGRLGLIRLREPLRVRFVFDRLRMQGNVENAALVDGLERRVDWLWDRIRLARPDLFEEVPERKPVKVFRDIYELVWGKVGRGEPTF